MVTLITMVASRERRTPRVEIDGHAFSVGDWTMMVPPDVPSADFVLIPLMPGQELSIDGNVMDPESLSDETAPNDTTIRKRGFLT